METQLIDILMNSSNLTTGLAIYILWTLKKINQEVKNNSHEIYKLKDMIKK
tara:strand:+ start:267 stop:419 length:153 start_codon:yes stop_codon:yes gene_type:complete